MERLLVVFMIFGLFACSPQVEENDSFIFNGKEYHFLSSDQGEDTFTSNGHLIEVTYGETTLVSTIIDEDIYLISGNQDSYTISRNGTLVLICNSELTCTGAEPLDFQEDFLNILGYYEE